MALKYIVFKVCIGLGRVSSCARMQGCNPTFHHFNVWNGRDCNSASCSSTVHPLPWSISLADDTLCRQPWEMYCFLWHPQTDIARGEFSVLAWSRPFAPFLVCGHLHPVRLNCGLEQDIVWVEQQPFVAPSKSTQGPVMTSWKKQRLAADSVSLTLTMNFLPCASSQINAGGNTLSSSGWL